MSKVLADKKSVEAQCLGHADVVIAGGGVTGTVAAGELALRGISVLLVQSRNTLLHEIVRAQLPLGQWGASVGRFRAELLRRASVLERGKRQSPLPFSLELMAEQLLSDAGVRILYEGFPLGCHKGTDTDCRAVVSVACRGRSGVVSASRCVVDCTDRAVLLRAAGAASYPLAPAPIRLVIKLTGLEAAGEARLTVGTTLGDLGVVVPVADERGWALTEIYVPAGCAGWEEPESAIATVCIELLDAIRAFAPAYAEAALAFIGDEYYTRPPFGLGAEKTAAQTVSLWDGMLLGGGSWSLGGALLPDAGYGCEVADLAHLGEQLAEDIYNAMEVGS